MYQRSLSYPLVPAGTSTRSRRSSQMFLLLSDLSSRLSGASRCSFPCTLIWTLLASIAILTPT
ncbi:hypothetical protein D3C71_1002390 [compost metagenome]